MRRALFTVLLVAAVGCSSSTTVVQTTTTTSTVTPIPISSPPAPLAEQLIDSMSDHWIEGFCKDTRSIGVTLTRALFMNEWDRTDVKAKAAWRELISRC